MHASVQQRVEVAAALRVRTQIATAEFYALIGREQPVQKIRYQVVTRGKAYHIVEWATGKVRGFRWTHKDAVSFAELLELDRLGMAEEHQIKQAR
ncbi:hypothetical protein SAMN04490179_4270 [Pseudomonas antarctica]|uniref:Uncharacterized protein n=1 Tax=Pseudomonas antarctica TaxID=219572 RepID=A0A1H0BFW6_9PSED|nr:hypothetical protein [Pseudomonas antarctica]KAF2406438.1 hypothetical protein PSAN_46130 [Pseudomonas antarctica]SDN44293.1 hypothetical protein SAMN04490179_4270 [Pseudomonas antarctica]